jgi:hypothetical protein
MSREAGSSSAIKGKTATSPIANVTITNPDVSATSPAVSPIGV